MKLQYFIDAGRNDLIKLFYAGDSTVTFNKIDSYPQAGLSQGLTWYLKDDVFLRPFGVNGRSTKSFIDEGRLKEIEDEIGEGDFLFIEFGHNDEKESDPSRYAAADAEYKDNLKRFADVARRHGAHPLIITSVARRLFDENNIFKPGSHGAYPKCAIEAANEAGVPYIDLNRISEDYLASVGDFASRPMYVYPKDNSHLTMHGAVVYAGFIAEGLSELGSPYSDLLIRRIDKPDRDNNYEKDETVD